MWFLYRYKYTYMEEMLSNVAGARQIFERWMEWEPDEQAWHSYINMELRYKEIERARSIYERYVMVHPEVKNWVKFAKFEERQSNTGTSSVYCITPISRCVINRCIINIIIHSKYFPVSDWLKPHA